MRLVLIGDGDDRAELERTASGGSIDFRGALAHDAVLSTCAAARGVVAPSISWETFGLMSIEAQSVGTPCAVSDMGGLPDSVKVGETGFVFQHGDVDACVKAIQKILHLTNDDFDRMALAAKKRVEARYTEAANYAVLQEIYGSAKRVLLVHNYYGSSAPSGENKVFEAERAMLEKRGVGVEEYTRHSDEIRLTAGDGWLTARLKKVWGLVKGALCTIGNPFAARALARKIREFKSDVVHFHNQFPLISPLAIRAAHRMGVKVVMTLHNYRTVCAAGVPTRGGKVCSECFSCGEDVECGDIEPCRCGEMGKKGGEPFLARSICPARLSIMPALRHCCYRGSLLATIPLAINIWLYRKCWAKWVDRFIVLSEFQRSRMIECGFPAEKIVVKGNFTEIPATPIIPAAERKDEVLYVGRLSREKGVFTLLEAWCKLQKMVGGVKNGNILLSEFDQRMRCEG